VRARLQKNSFFVACFFAYEQEEKFCVSDDKEKKTEISLKQQ